MSPRVSPFPSLTCLLLMAVLLLPVLACGGPASEPDSPGETAAAGSPGEDEASTTARSYTVRGLVRQLPNPDIAGRPEIQILHEAVPDFVNSEGYETGMQGMTMPFPVADDVSLEGIEAGSTVIFTFQVDWENEPYMLLTNIQPAPPEPQTSDETSDEGSETGSEPENGE